MKPSISLLLASLALSGAALTARADVLSDARRLSASGQTAQALTLVDRGLAATPRDPELRFLRGVLLIDLGRSDDALAVFRALHEEFPELPDPPNNLAVLLAARGELEQARTALETALRNNPRHRAARENLGDVYLGLAIRHWQSLASDAQPEPLLSRKLALARELAASLANAKR